jgi:predicted lipid carrier protein YhbT
VHATDAQGEWLVQVGPDGIKVSGEHATADCTVVGPASDLHLLLWNRRTADGLEVHGDKTLLDRWHNWVQIR